MPLKCPGCQSPLDPSATSCNVCLRNRTRQEMFRGMREVKNEETRRGRRPLVIGAAVLLLSIGGFLLWSHRAEVASWKSKASDFKDRVLMTASSEQGSPGGHLDAKKLSPAAALEEVRPSAPPPAPPAPPAAAKITPEPQYTTTLPSKYRKNGRPNAEPGEGWAISGLAYGLLDLQPAAGALVTFTDKNSGKVFKAATNVKGRYALMLPAIDEGGYAVAVRHKWYRENFLDEMDPPYNHQSLARREEAAQMMQETAVLHVPVLLGKEESALDLNLVLLPKP